jgi:hypothetical protein
MRGAQGASTWSISMLQPESRGSSRNSDLLRTLEHGLRGAGRILCIGLELSLIYIPQADLAIFCTDR